MKFRSGKLLLFLLGLALVLPAAHGATTWEAYAYNRDGVRKFGEKSYFPAYQDFLKALQSDPLNPLVQLNLGRALEASEDFEKAEKAYRSVLQWVPKDAAIRFETLFNLAGVQARLKKIDEALATYQEALKLQPDSIEVKTNIELLWQGGGEGEGESQSQQQDQKDSKGGRGDKPENSEDQKKKKPTPQPQPDDPEMVKRILDEIKNQEQSIRAKEYEKSAKDAPKAKDW